jgi:chromosome segregation ATPase
VSDTPETDAAVCSCARCTAHVSANVARDLERRLAESERARADLQKELNLDIDTMSRGREAIDLQAAVLRQRADEIAALKQRLEDSELLVESKAATAESMRHKLHHANEQIAALRQRLSV